MKNQNQHFTYLSLQQLDGRKPPSNTPCDKPTIDQMPIARDVHLMWPYDQIYYTVDELRQLIGQDYSKHPLVRNMASLARRSAIPQKHRQTTGTIPRVYSMRAHEDPLVTEKKKEILNNQSWLNEVSNQQSEVIEYIKDLKFRLNQLAADNYKLISSHILKMVNKNDQFMQESIKLIVDKGIHENKYRQLYSQLCKDIMKIDNKIADDIEDILILQIQSQNNAELLLNNLSQLGVEDQQIYLNKRKSKYIGCFKFIAQLYRDRIFTICVINDLIINVINQFIVNCKQNTLNKEEPIEGLVELLQYLKRETYQSQNKQDAQCQKDFTSNLSKAKQWTSGSFRFSQDGIKIILQTIGKQFNVSERINLLIFNLLEKIDHGWVQQRIRGGNKQVRGETADSSDSEREEMTPIVLKQQNTKQSIKLDVNNLDKINEEDNDYSVTKQLSIRNIIEMVNSCFKQQQHSLFDSLLKILQQINSLECMETFWKCYFNNCSLITKDNCIRVAHTYQIYKCIQDKCQISIIFNELNSRFTDWLYDAAESPFGIIYWVALLQDFITEDIQCLKLLIIDECDEDIQQFWIKLLPRVLTNEQLSTEIGALTLQQFGQDTLQLETKGLQQLWDSIS